MAKEGVVRQFAEAAFDAGTDVELSGNAAEAAVKVAFLVPEVASADPLWSSLNGLLLY